MPEQILDSEIFDSKLPQKPIDAISRKTIVFFLLLVGQMLSQMALPMVMGYLIEDFDLPYKFMAYTGTFSSVLLAVIIMVLALRDKIPASIFIGLLAIKAPVFSCILYLLSYALKNIYTNGKG